MRVHELAKELNITSKELIEHANEKLGLNLKSHSSTVNDTYIDKIKALYNKTQKQGVKPKAFIVKKQKNVENTQDIKPEEKKEVVLPKTVSKLEIVKKPQKVQVQKQEKPKLENKSNTQTDTAKTEPQRHQNSTDRLSSLPSMTRKNFSKPEVDSSLDDKQDKKPKNTKIQRTPSSPIKRHIIPQDMYQNQGRGNKKRKKEHDN